MIIRQFTGRDFKRIYEIEAMSFENTYGNDIILKLYKIGSGFLVAEINDYVVGYIIFWIKQEGEGHIISLAVDKNYRGIGIGWGLLAKAVKVLKECDLDYVSLEVDSENEGGVRFYKKFGFKVDRKVPNYYENGNPALIMFYRFKDKTNN